MITQATFTNGILVMLTVILIVEGFVPLQNVKADKRFILMVTTMICAAIIGYVFMNLTSTFPT
jgi:hypothetical protein